MSQPGYLDFFVLEASEYVERLDALIGAAGETGPDAAEFVRVARALRGSATMARAGGMAEIAGGVERAGRALRDGTLWWDARLRGALVAAVDDCKILLRALKSWGAAEDARVRARVAELAAFAPPWRGGSPTPAAGIPGAGSTPGASPAVPAGGAAAYLATAASGIVIALDDLVARPESREALTNALGRVRALRGVAALKDLPPMSEVVEAVERAAKPAELSGGPPTAAQGAVLAAARDVLRRVAAELSAGQRPATTGADVDALANATGALAAEGGEDAERIVPIAELFFPDAGPHIVARAPNPPTTPPERFRLEVVSQAEHLRRLVADAREARDAGRRERVGRELRAALHALEEGAHGFGEREVAGFVASYRDDAVALDTPALTAIDEVASLLADPTSQSGELARRMGELSRGRSAPMAAVAATPGRATPGRATPRGRTTPSARDRQPTPTGRQLHDLLETGIAGFNLLEQKPLSEPVPIAEEMEIVPVESLVYRGRAALARAREIRERLRASSLGADGKPAAPLDQEALDELLDLLDLATAE